MTVKKHTYVVGWQRTGTYSIDTLKVGVMITDGVYTATDDCAILCIQ